MGLAQSWKLAERDQIRLLGGLAPSTLYEWRRRAPRRLDRDQMERISYLLGIHAVLHRLFTETPDHMPMRIRRTPPWPVLNGRSLLDHLLIGGIRAMHDVRMLLESHAGGDAMSGFDVAPLGGLTIVSRPASIEGDAPAW